MYIPTTTLTQGSSGGLLDYEESTATVTVSATNAASAQTLVALPARAYDGSTEIWLEGYTPQAQPTVSAGGGLAFNLWDDAVDLGRVFAVFGALSGAGSGLLVPGFFRVKLTPSAGTHTYIWKVYRDVANGTVAANAVTPMYLASYLAQ